jgi:hypothetical protein
MGIRPQVKVCCGPGAIYRDSREFFEPVARKGRPAGFGHKRSFAMLGESIDYVEREQQSA